MSQSSTPRPAESATDLTSVADQWVSDYLDRLGAPLLGFVPIEDRKRFQEEIRQNLEGRRTQYALDGLDPLSATNQALLKLGAPRRLGEAFVYEYQRHRGTGALARHAGKPVWWSFVLFGQGALFALVLLFGRLYLVPPEPNTFGMSVSEARKIWPEPLPLPDHHPTWYALWIYAFLAPVICGLLLGYIAPFWNTRPALIASASASLLTFSLVSYVPTLWEGTLLAYLQLLWWAPCGVLAAYVGSTATIRYRTSRDPWSKAPVQ